MKIKKVIRCTSAVLMVCLLSARAEASCQFVLSGEVDIRGAVDNGPSGDSYSDARFYTGRLFLEENGMLKGEVGISETQSAVVSPAEKDPSGQPRVLRNLKTIYSFSATDQIIVEGLQAYRPNEARTETDRPIIRGIIGGTGKYKTARGEVITIRRPSGQYERQFNVAGVGQGKKCIPAVYGASWGAN